MVSIRSSLSNKVSHREVFFIKLLRNEFGVQFEIFGHSFQTLNKTQNLIAEKSGRSTVDMPSRNQKDQNCWAIVLASSPDQEFDEFAQVNFNFSIHYT